MDQQTNTKSLDYRRGELKVNDVYIGDDGKAPRDRFGQELEDGIDIAVSLYSGMIVCKVNRSNGRKFNITVKPSDAKRFEDEGGISIDGWLRLDNETKNNVLNSLNMKPTKEGENYGKKDLLKQPIKRNSIVAFGATIKLNKNNNIGNCVFIGRVADINKNEIKIKTKEVGELTTKRTDVNYIVLSDQLENSVKKYISQSEK